MIERHFIQQGIKRVELDEYLAKEMDKAGFTKSEIVKTPLVTRIIVNVVKPGLAIGKSGSNIRKITETIATRFGIENPQLEIRELPIPELDARAMVNKVKNAIEKGFSWRSIAYRTVKDIESKGAQGIELVMSGKLTGKGGRKRRQRIGVGYMKKTGDQVKLVDYAKATAYPKPGAIGIKLRIVKPDTIFPDKVNIAEILRQRRELAQKKEETAVQEVLAAQEMSVAQLAAQVVPEIVAVEVAAEEVVLEAPLVVEEKKEGHKAHPEKHVEKKEKAVHAKKTEAEKKE
mgnify:CR=1 FL=1